MSWVWEDEPECQHDTVTRGLSSNFGRPPFDIDRCEDCSVHWRNEPDGSRLAYTVDGVTGCVTWLGKHPADCGCPRCETPARGKATDVHP